MAEVKKARLFLRRGTDTDRITTTLCEGELGYSTDAFRVVVGDGTTAGGISLGTTVHVSAGSLAPHFHTKLTTASAGGLAHIGDLAVFPALTYQNVTGGTVYPDASATTVMLLTGSPVTDPSSWVSVNSGVPWGNLSVSADDISGDKVHGGDISGDVTFSGTISTTSMTATSAFVRGLAGTGNRSVVVTSTGQLSASTDSATVADGTLQFLNSPVAISISPAGSAFDWLNFTNPGNVPKDATGGLFQFFWSRSGSTGGQIQALYLRSGSASYALSAAVTQQEDTSQKGSTQVFCPLSSGSGNVGFDFKMDDGAGNFTPVCFNEGYNLSLIGYM